MGHVIILYSSLKAKDTTAGVLGSGSMTILPRHPRPESSYDDT